MMAHNMIFLYSQILPVYNAFFELLETQNFKKIFGFSANHGGPLRDTKLSETPSYQSLNISMSAIQRPQNHYV